MTTVVELEIPADRLGFAQTFDRVPTFEFQVAGMIGDAPPLVRASGSDSRTVENALEGDPSVDVIASLTDSERPDPTREDGTRDQWLFRLEFGDGVKLFQEIVTENDGAILTARGRDTTWSVQLLFHEHETVSACHELFEHYEYQVNVTRVAGFDDLDRARTPLTDTQYETICAAHELGYFDVPREITLQELAAELDISHQALSERLRRSHAALISAELSEGLTTSEIDP
ncbi:helix-turn-helix domain-containing protein [Natrarchaeobius halalkaliphilus]|uniref:Helix-turn-helix domain-containing protein n=1 Tax=Natrarchaeobius halalkaliphilus TaxID=1679091 RepID=A0A3N6MC88_9EURY|nr:helix-turn-helix domain-containing protein [Natrarchaeobius halalkaliphilus]RQG91316.1 helix-turn-helix domain-containing protein [Natrarchaeobius halalkaliphilus]